MAATRLGNRCKHANGLNKVLICENETGKPFRCIVSLPLSIAVNDAQFGPEKTAEDGRFQQNLGPKRKAFCERVTNGMDVTPGWKRGGWIRSC